MDPSASATALTVALLFLVGGGFSSAAPTTTSTTPAPAIPAVTSTAAPIHYHHAEPLVVFGSGRSLPVSAHRRILDALHADAPLTVRLASGEERYFPSGPAYTAAAAASAEAGDTEFRGAELVVPAEAFPCEVVADIMEVDFAQRTYLVLPGGEAVPYVRYMEEHDAGVGVAHHLGGGSAPAAAVAAAHYDKPAASAVSYPGSNPYQHQPLFHKQPVVYDWLTPFDKDVPEDKLMVALGGTQRLTMKVHDAILDSYKAGQPVDVDLVSGRHVTVPTFDELLAKQVDPRYMGAQVQLAGGAIRVPIETYRAVVDAHKHKGVYVVDPDDHRMPYGQYAERREAAKEHAKKADKKKRKHKH